jgi:hypothetical protein
VTAPLPSVAFESCGLRYEARLVWSGPGKRVQIFVNGRLKAEGRWNGTAIRGCDVRLGQSEQQSFALYSKINHELLMKGAHLT